MGVSIKIAVWLALCGCAIADDRFGWDTHFQEQGQNPQNWDAQFLAPFIAKTPAARVRDDLNWAWFEGSPGVYTIPAWMQTWINYLVQNNIKLVLCGPSFSANPPAFYMVNGKWPETGTAVQTIQTAFANFCTWAATHLPVDTIELFNEPNNYMAGGSGNPSAWESVVYNACNAAADAIHAANSTVKVIGLGAQGQQLLDMLALGPCHLDGISYHPYGSLPENADEPPFTDYMTFIGALRQKILATQDRQLELHETEAAPYQNTGQYFSAIWEGRRLALSSWLGVNRTFFYDFCDSDTAQAAIDYFERPNQVYYVVQRFYQHVTPNLKPSSQPIAVNGGSDALWASESGAFRSVLFQAGDPNWPYETACIVWYATMWNGVPAYSNVTLTVPHPSYGTVWAIDLTTGAVWQPQAAQSGGNVVISNAQLWQGATIYLIFNGYRPMP